MYKDYVAPVQNTQFLVEQGFPPGPDITFYWFQADCGNHIPSCPGCNKIEWMGQAVRHDWNFVDLYFFYSTRLQVGI
jgi:hypothetical protein